MFLVIAITSASFMNIAMKSLVAYSTYWTYVIAIAVGLVMALGGFFLFDHGESGLV
jgi:low affinity Fe/Cu permease